MQTTPVSKHNKIIKFKQISTVIDTRFCKLNTEKRRRKIS